MDLVEKAVWSLEQLHASEQCMDYTIWNRKLLSVNVVYILLFHPRPSHHFPADICG